MFPPCPSAPEMGEVRDKPIVSYVGDKAVIPCKIEKTKPEPTSWIWYKANGTEKVGEHLREAVSLGFSCQHIDWIFFFSFFFFLFPVVKLRRCFWLSHRKLHAPQLLFNSEHLFSGKFKLAVEWKPKQKKTANKNVNVSWRVQVCYSK